MFVSLGILRVFAAHSIWCTRHKLSGSSVRTRRSLPVQGLWLTWCTGEYYLASRMPSVDSAMHRNFLYVRKWHVS